jgi:hypothetical protein
MSSGTHHAGEGVAGQGIEPAAIIGPATSPHSWMLPPGAARSGVPEGATQVS